MCSPPDRAERRPSLPRNVKLLGAASLLNDVASEMIFPLMPQFLATVLGGTRFHLGIIEGVADSAARLLKLWSGGRLVRVTQTSNDLVAARLVQIHAQVVSLFVKNGRAEMHKDHL